MLKFMQIISEAKNSFDKYYYIRIVLLPEAVSPLVSL